jgi:ribosome-binding protein aMBF1 (putative translation factor)
MKNKKLKNKRSMDIINLLGIKYKIMEHQDWNDVVLHVKRDPKRKNYDTKNVDVRKKTTHASYVGKIEKACENDTYHVKKVSPQFQQSIQRTRQEKNLTQKQLATMCNLQTSVIRDYEAGTAIPSPKEVNIIKNVLGIKNCHKKLPLSFLFS